MNRGSEWHKWDLHFHTPASYDYEDDSVTNEDLINGLLANGVAAVAITDHHVIDVARIQELQQIDSLLCGITSWKSERTSRCDVYE